MEKYRLAICCFAAIFLGILTVTAQDAAYYNKRCKESYDKRDYKSVISNATLSLNTSITGEAYWWRAVGNSYLSNYMQCISDVTKALPYYGNGSTTTLGGLHVLRGDAHYALKEFDLAADDYEKVLDKYTYSDKKRIWINLAKSLIALEEFEDAVDAYKAAIALETSAAGQSKLYVDMADAKYDASSFSTSDIMADFSTAIAKDNLNGEAFEGRGACRYLRKEYDLAVTDLTSAIKLFEKKTISQEYKTKLHNIYRTLAGIAYSKKQYEEAKSQILQAITYYPKSVNANWDLYGILAAEKNYADARAQIKKTILLAEDDKTKAACFQELHLIEKRMLLYGPALQSIQECIRLQPAEASYHWYKGELLGDKHNYAGAIQSYDSAISLYKKDTASLSVVLRTKGQAQLQLKETTSALKSLQQALNYKENFYNYYELGKFFKQVLKQDVLAESNFRKAMQAAVSGTYKKDTSFNYAYATAAMGDVATTERLIRKFIVDANTDQVKLANELHNAACLYTILNNSAKALQYLEQSLIAGYDDFDHLINDYDLEQIQSTTAYKNILLKYKVPSPVY